MASVIPPAPVENPNFNSYVWVDWYQKVRNAINAAQSVAWTSVTGKPTTIAGYGITDATSVVSGALRIVGAINDGTGANTATLTNSPIAGDPNKWLEIDDNGTTRYIPAW